MPKKKTPKKANAALKARREMLGPAVISLLCSHEEAAARVECGWQPLGKQGDDVIMVADAEADQAWQDREGPTDE